jgi:hypothetical protein
MGINSKKIEFINCVSIFVLVLLQVFTVSYSIPVEAEPVTEAQRASPVYQADQAWQNRLVPRIAIRGQHDTLSEYAAKCKAATGIDVPQFSCSNGSEVPGQGDTPANPNPTHCDQPNVLNSRCDPGSKFQVLPGRTADAVAVAHCRKYGLPKDGDQYNDIAVIQYNKNNGALCFYQALNNLPGEDIPPPSAGYTVNWKDGKPHWKSPENTEGIGCTGCHDNGGFIRSEYLAQLKPPGHVLPNTSDGFNNLDTPVKYVGLDYKTNKSWSIVASPAPNDSGCTGCHRLAVNNHERNGLGTALNFANIATARTQASKNPHNPSSPIWMRPGQITYNVAAEASATKIRDCARVFKDSNFISVPEGCTITPLGEPWSDVDKGWHNPVAFGDARLAQGKYITPVFNQASGIFTALTVDKNGVMNVTWLDLNDGQGWHPPIAFGGNHLVPGAYITPVFKQSDTVYTALTIDKNGVMNVTWLDLNDGQGWHPPVAFGGNHLVPGAHVTPVFNQASTVFTALTADKNGVMNVAWLDLNDGQGWHPPAAFGGSHLVPGAYITPVFNQASTVFTALTADKNGVMNVTWLDLNDGQGWHPPAAFGGSHLVPGAYITPVFNQASTVFTALTADKNGVMNVAWLDLNDGQGWHPPAAFGGNHLVAGAQVTPLFNQASGIFTALTIDKNGVMNVTWLDISN